MVLVISLLAPLVLAQPSVPQSYTLNASTAMALESMSTGSAVEVKVSRFGPREFVNVTAPPNAGKAFHVQHWFDLVSHKAYSLDVLKNTCTWMTYTGPDMPIMYDPVATPPPSAEDLAQLKKNTVRRENVNGIAANLTETSSDQGKASIWVAVNGNFPVKAMMAFPGAPPMLMIEVKELHFDKPSVALLTPPANCTTQAQGEWSATGMSSHFEFHVEGQGSGSVDLKTGKATGDATVKSTTKPQ
jgi:hypothetical protein